jgi:hypothetical protein
VRIEMNVLLTMVLLLQIVGTPMPGATPITDGYLIVSEGNPEFPPLPTDIQPVTINEDWELLYYEVIASSREYVVRGELRNTSTNPLTTPTVIVTASDGSQFNLHPDIDIVGPGERAPFRFSPWEDSIIAALNQSQELSFTGVCEGFYGMVPVQDFAWEFRDVEIEYDASQAAARIEGTVTNVGQIPSDSYAPMLFAFSSDGRYVGSLFAFGFPGTLLVGAETAFEFDHGFAMYHTGEPFNGAGSGAVFVLAMVVPTYGWGMCI